MPKYICRECGYTFSAENPEPEMTKIIETDDLKDEFKCPKCGKSSCQLKEDDK